MARKTPGNRKPATQTETPEIDEAAEVSEMRETSVDANVTDETPSSKPKAKPKEDPASGTGVGIADIRKAAAFANSVGGLDKAMSLLQILKVAKEVQ